MGSGWENPGPARQLIVAGPSGEVLIYASSPARAGNLILAISSAAGTDLYGNHFEQGLTLANYPGTTSDQNIHFDVNNVDLAEIFFNTFGNELTLIAAAVVLESGLNSLAVNGNGIFVGGPLQIGNGFTGQVTSRDSTYSKSIPNNAATLITALTTTLQSTDYGGEWSAGTFTAPAKGFYDASHFANSPGGVTDFRCTIRLNGSNIAEGGGQVSSATTVDVSCSANVIGMHVGDTLDAVVLQINGGATAKTVSGRFAVSRRLA